MKVPVSKSSSSVGTERQHKATSTGRSSTKRMATTTPRTSTRPSCGKKLTSNSQSGIANGSATTTAKKTSKTKKIVKVTRTKQSSQPTPEMTQHYSNSHSQYPPMYSENSVASHSTNGVMSFDQILTSSGILATSSPYGRLAYPVHGSNQSPGQPHQQQHQPQHQPEGQEKPPRPPIRTQRPHSANAASSKSKDRSTLTHSSSSSSAHRHPQEHHHSMSATGTGAGVSTPRGRRREGGRGRINGSPSLRSHSLTSEPVSLSQFNITHSPYRVVSTSPSSSHNMPATYMSSRRGLK